MGKTQRYNPPQPPLERGERGLYFLKFTHIFKLDALVSWVKRKRNSTKQNIESVGGVGRVGSYDTVGWVKLENVG